MLLAPAADAWPLWFMVLLLKMPSPLSFCRLIFGTTMVAGWVWGCGCVLFRLWSLIISPFQTAFQFTSCGIHRPLFVGVGATECY